MLVTILARNPDSFILKPNSLLIYLIRTPAPGKSLQPKQLYLSVKFAKIAPWWLAHRENFPSVTVKVVTEGKAGLRTGTRIGGQRCQHLLPQSTDRYG